MWHHYYQDVCQNINEIQIAFRWKLTTSFDTLKIIIFDIVLLETVNCNSKDELRQRERFYIENNICVNETYAGIFIELGIKTYNQE